MPDNYHNVSANFDVCLYWGFINTVLIFSLFLYMRVLNLDDESRCSKSCKELFFVISMFVLIASWLSQMITVAIMRYRHAGKVCSGDYNEALGSKWSFGNTQNPYLHDTGAFLTYAFTG